jgi:type IV pilus assembly protein PilF
VSEIRRCASSAIVTSFVFLLLAGCASNPSVGNNIETTTGSSASDNQARARIRLQLAVGYYEQRQMEIALDEVRQALQADPEFADAYSVRGLIQMEMGEHRLAEESFLQAIKLAPNNPDFNNNYGWFLCQTGRERQSIAYFDAALKIRTYQSPAKALNNAGVCSLKMNDNAAAERYFSQAFKLEPGNLATNENLGRLYYASRDYPRAQFYVGRLTKAEAVAPGVLWLAIKIERKLGDQGAEASLVTQLRRRYPNSAEYAAYQRGAFDE